MMQLMDGYQIQGFGRDEFPEDPVKYADPEFLRALSEYRMLWGRAIYPSPVSGALARFDAPESQHYCDDRESPAVQSRAGDVFVTGSAVQAWQLALASQLWGGIGLYTDTKYTYRGVTVEWPMLHLDIRPLGVGHSQPTVLIWVRTRLGYAYPQYMANGGEYLVEHLRLCESLCRVRDKVLEE